MAEDTYHHGALRVALLEHAAAASRVDGPDAIVLRSIAQDIGVSAPAAYRHFADRDALVLALSQQLSQDMTRFISDSVDAVAPSSHSKSAALRRFRALVHSYIEFAEENPGWYRVIFKAGARDAPTLDPNTETTDGLLARTLDELQAVGLITPGKREHAELWAWSSVHGLVSLRIDGPLARLSKQELKASEDLITDNILRALSD